MGSRLIAGKEQSIAIDLGKKDIYGASGFKIIYSKERSGNVITKEDAMKEVIAPVDKNSCTADGDTKAGSDRVKVKDKDANNKVSNFKVGDVVRIKDTNNYFNIAKVDADNGYLYPRSELKFDIKDGDELERVGNTGLYEYSKFKPEEPGRYLFIISNPSIGLYNKSKIIEVISHNEDSIYDKLLELEQKLEEKDLIDGEIIA